MTREEVEQFHYMSELEAINGSLRDENAALRADNAALKAAWEADQGTKEILRLKIAKRDTTIVNLKEDNKKLRELNSYLATRKEEIQAQLTALKELSE